MPQELNFDEGVNRLQAATLHLARAVNRLIEVAQQLDRRAPKADPASIQSSMGLLGPYLVDVQRALQDASDDLRHAVDQASGGDRG